MKLTIIIPVYNERNSVEEIIRKVRNSNIGKIEKEIIIVDDFSNDGTREILNKMKNEDLQIIFKDKNEGKGSAVREGLNCAKGDIILIQDADLEYDPNEYLKLISPILKGDTDIVYGSRFLKKDRNKIKLNRFYIANRILSLITSLLFFRKITDMETCYKVFRKEVIKKISIKSNRFGLEPELTSKIINRGHKIIEVPISYSPRSKKEGKKIDLFDGFEAIWCLIRYRLSK